jgi:dCTP deaminase
VPGVLSKNQVRELASKRFILDASDKPSDFDYSSFDLRISDEAYELVDGCVKPFGRGYLRELTTQNLARKLEQESDGTFRLRRRKSYLLRIRERIPELQATPIHGTATAKSSIGRMDVLARLIVDGMDEYEGFHPGGVSNGEMYLEVTPMTFNVRVKPGTSLTQLRLFKGDPKSCLMQGQDLLRTVLECDDSNHDATLSVDLSPDQIAGNAVSAFSATLQSDDTTYVDLWKHPEEEKPKPWDHWKFECADANDRLKIEKDKFYIIRSHEKIHLPPGVAVYCRASDETIGEMRIHYAGFVHPLFGSERSDKTRGTPLIFEVRGHDIDVSLRHREKMARLEFYRMSQDAAQEQDRTGDPYASQTLKLSQFFAAWPNAAVCENGKVVPK